MLKSRTRMQLDAYGNLPGRIMVISEPEINIYTLIQTLTVCDMEHNNLSSIFKGQLRLKSYLLVVYWLKTHIFRTWNVLNMLKQYNLTSMATYGNDRYQKAWFIDYHRRNWLKPSVLTFIFAFKVLDNVNIYQLWLTVLTHSLLEHQ